MTPEQIRQREDDARTLPTSRPASSAAARERLRAMAKGGQR